MAANENTFDWRGYDRKIFLTAAILFPLLVLIGFARTYYLKFAFGTPPLPSLLVHMHGLLMTLWVGFFIAQVYLIRTKNHKLHMQWGMLGIGFAVAIVIVGFFTAAAGAKYGSPTAPPDVPPLSFLAVPLIDLVTFASLFAAAIWYRKRPADHKRLMLLIAMGLLPPALGRFPIASLQSLGPLFFFGVPSVLAIGFLIFDTWRNKKLNRVYLAGTVFLIASYPLRIMLSGTDAWHSFAVWLTGWAA